MEGALVREVADPLGVVSRWRRDGARLLVPVALRGKLSEQGSVAIRGTRLAYAVVVQVGSLSSMPG